MFSRAFIAAAVLLLTGVATRPHVDSEETLSLDGKENFSGSVDGRGNFGTSVDGTGSLSGQIAGDRDSSGGELGLDEQGCEACVGIFGNYLDLIQSTDRPSLVFYGVLMAFLGLSWLMLDTAQYCFTPTLFYWTNRLRLSPEVAAATLLAVANGAQDTAEAFAAVGAKDLALGLSCLAGSSLCDICCNTGACLLIVFVAELRSETETVKQPAFDSGRYLEGICFLVLAVIALVIILRHADIQLYHAMTLPAIYCAYLLRLVCSSSAETAETPETSESSRRKDRRRSSLALEDALACVHSPGEDESVLCSLLWILMLPVRVVRLLTVPPCDQKWDLPRRVCHCLCPAGLLLFCHFLGYTEKLGSCVTASVGVSTALLGAGLFASSKTGGRLPWFYTPMTVVSLLSSVFWMAVLSSESISMVESMGRYLQVSRMRFGFTVMAWASDAANICVCISLALAGQYAMSLNGIIAGQLYSVTISFAAAIIFMAAKADDGRVVLYQHGWPSSISILLLASVLSIFLALALLATFVLCDATITKPRCAIVSIGIYASFFLFMWLHTVREVPQEIGASSA